MLIEYNKMADQTQKEEANETGIFVQHGRGTARAKFHRSRS